ncbi:SNF21_5 [Sanghuangporus weigelae]
MRYLSASDIRHEQICTTSESRTSEPSPPSPVEFTEEQVAALRAQTRAFQLIQRGAPIPEHIQAALLPGNNAIANLEKSLQAPAQPDFVVSDVGKRAANSAADEKDDCHEIAENIIFDQTAPMSTGALNVAAGEKDDCHGIAENVTSAQMTPLGTGALNVAVGEKDDCHGIVEKISGGQMASMNLGVAAGKKNDCHGIAENIMLGQIRPASSHTCSTVGRIRGAALEYL